MSDVDQPPMPEPLSNSVTHWHIAGEGATRRVHVYLNIANVCKDLPPEYRGAFHSAAIDSFRRVRGTALAQAMREKLEQYTTAFTRHLSDNGIMLRSIGAPGYRVSPTDGSVLDAYIELEIPTNQLSRCEPLLAQLQQGPGKTLIPVSFPLPLDPHRYGNIADLAGIALFINELYGSQRPEDRGRFGTDAQRGELERFVREQYRGPISLDYAGFFDAFVTKLESMKLNPFKGMKVAFVGGYPHDGDQPTTRAAAPLERLFTLYHIAKPTVGHIHTANVGDMARAMGGKVDCVITGNAVNDPDNHTNDDTLLACASLTKKGGRVIHMLNYGEAYESKHIDDPKLISFAGQKLARNIPPGPYMQFDTQAMILEQVNEVNHAPMSVGQYRAGKSTPYSMPPAYEIRDWEHYPADRIATRLPGKGGKT